jgi:hypothetical protein
MANFNSRMGLTVQPAVGDSRLELDGHHHRLSIPLCQWPLRRSILQGIDSFSPFSTPRLTRRADSRNVRDVAAATSHATSRSLPIRCDSHNLPRRPKTIDGIAW